MLHFLFKFKKISLAGLRNRLVFANIVDFLHQTRLRWFEHVERMDIKKKTATVDSLKLMAKEGEVDHVKHGPSLSKTI